MLKHIYESKDADNMPHIYHDLPKQALCYVQST